MGKSETKPKNRKNDLKGHDVRSNKFTSQFADPPELPEDLSDLLFGDDNRNGFMKWER